MMLDVDQGMTVWKNDAKLGAHLKVFWKRPCGQFRQTHSLFARRL
jgi:hypothetical protein